MHMIVWMISIWRYSLLFREILKTFIYELREVANHVNTRPNALGRTDQHKVGFGHKQLNPSQIGVIDLYESVKDVGQTCMLSPYADLTILQEYDRNKYPNIKYDLFKFIQDEFRDYSALYFNCETIEEYNEILDKLCYESRITLDYYIEDIISNGLGNFIMNSKGGF